MPELPEVQTTVDGINRTLRGLGIKDVWTDYFSNLYENHKQIKSRKFFNLFKKDVVGAKILKAERRAKNILIYLSNDKVILVHMKMTGHLLFGRYAKRRSRNAERGARSAKHRTQEKKSYAGSNESFASRDSWVAIGPGPLRDDPYNRFIHLVFALSDGNHLALSDMRKFAKVTVLPSAEIDTELGALGPEPLDKSFELKAFRLRLGNKPNGKIKQVLMDQSVVAGIGNIYSDEILWASGINPARKVSGLKPSETQKIFRNMKLILRKGIALSGDSMSDYRNLFGKKGEFQEKHRAYGRTGKPCPKPNCRGTIKRIKIGGRSAHFCPIHQK